MIEYVNLTGRIDKGLVECKEDGRTFLARPIFMTGFQSIPSEAWLAKYSKSYFGVVIYANNNTSGDSFEYNRPLFLGLVPVSNEDYVNRITDRHFIISEKYRVVLDDVSDELTIERLGGESIHVKEGNVWVDSNLINLGQQNADYFAVLGEKLNDWHSRLINVLRTGKVNTSIGPQPFMPDTQTRLQALADDLDSYLSDVNKLD